MKLRLGAVDQLSEPVFKPGRGLKPVLLVTMLAWGCRAGEGRAWHHPGGEGRGLSKGSISDLCCVADPSSECAWAQPDLTPRGSGKPEALEQPSDQMGCAGYLLRPGWDGAAQAGRVVVVWVEQAFWARSPSPPAGPASLGL